MEARHGRRRKPSRSTAPRRRRGVERGAPRSRGRGRPRDLGARGPAPMPRPMPRPTPRSRNRSRSASASPPRRPQGCGRGHEIPAPSCVSSPRHSAGRGQRAHRLGIPSGLSANIGSSFPAQQGVLGSIPVDGQPTPASSTVRSAWPRRFVRLPLSSRPEPRRRSSRRGGDAGAGDRRRQPRCSRPRPRVLPREPRQDLPRRARAVRRGEPVDAITLVDELDERSDLEQVGGKVRIHELAALVPASANARHYASIVREAATLRGLIRAGGEISRLGWERPGDATELVDQAEQIVFDLSQQRASAEFSHIEQLLKESFERITALYESGADVTGVPSGFRDLDRITSGFQPERSLIILAARPRWGSRRSASARAPTSRSGIRHRWLSSRSRCRSRR